MVVDASGSSDIALSIIIPSYGDLPQLTRCVAALAVQTLALDRFEVLVVDDGSPEPVPAKLLHAFPRHRLIRQENAGPAAARNMALRHAQAPICVLLNADAVPSPELLDGHLRAHAQRPRDSPHAVLGRFDWLPKYRSAFVEFADRAHVLFPYDLLTPGNAVPTWACWTGNFSLPTATLRAVGGMDERYRRALFEDVELGQRLMNHSIPVVYYPGLLCGHNHAMTLAAWMRRAEWMGHEWVRFAHSHGGAAFSILGGDDEPTEAWGQELLGGWLNQFDAQVARIAHLQRRCDALDAARASGILTADGFAAAIDAQAPAAVSDIMGINTCAILRGIHGAIGGHNPDALRAFAARTAGPTSQRAVVLQARTAEAIGQVQRLLNILPERTALIVTHVASLNLELAPLPLTLQDPRLTLLRLTSPAPKDLFAQICAVSPADVFVFLQDGPLPPRSTELSALFRFAGASPMLGAVGLGPAQAGAHPTARLQETISTHALAVRRDATWANAPASVFADVGLLQRLNASAVLKAVLSPAGP